ncbi:hypothetical protein YC2023_065556 [Brassica napus]
MARFCSYLNLTLLPRQIQQMQGSAGAAWRPKHQQHKKETDLFLLFRISRHKSLLSLNEEGIFENVSLVVVKMKSGTMKVVNIQTHQCKDYGDKQEYFSLLMKLEANTKTLTSFVPRRRLGFYFFSTELSTPSSVVILACNFFGCKYLLVIE